MSRLKKTLIFLIPFLIIGLFILFFNLPDIVIFNKNQDLYFIPIIILFIIIPLMAIFYMKKNKVSKKTREWVVLFLVLGGGISIGLISKYNSERDLVRNGEYVMGVVSEKSYGNERWGIRCAFVVNGDQYVTFTKSIDYSEEYEVGDSLEIFYSKKNPENAIIVELEDFIFY